MAGTERLSSEELAAILSAGTPLDLDCGVSSQDQPDELLSSHLDRLSRSELLGAYVLGFFRRHRLAVGISLTVVLMGIAFAGWFSHVRTPPVDPVIHARIRYVSTYSQTSVNASTGAVTGASLRTTLRITSDDPQSQLQITGITILGHGLPPILLTQDGASVILSSAITCPTAVPLTLDLRLRVVRLDRWGRSIAGELPILPGVGGDLLSGHGVWVPQPTEPGVNPVVDMLHHYCAEAHPNPYSGTMTIGPTTTP